MPTPTPMRIVSCDTFADVLREATARTLQLDPSGWPLLAHLQAQLAFMAQTTANGRIPNADERGSTSIGPIAARNLEEVDPVYADQLEELDYSFRRYHLLPAGPAMPRRAILQLWSGSDEAFRKLVLTPGVPHTVGSASQPPTTANAPAHDQVRSDPPLAPVHFEVLWDGMVAHVRPLGPNLITLGGLPVLRGELAHRGWMTASGTTFRFIVEARTPPSAASTGPWPPCLRCARQAHFTLSLMLPARPAPLNSSRSRLIPALRSSRMRLTVFMTTSPPT